MLCLNSEFEDVTFATTTCILAIYLCRNNVFGMGVADGVYSWREIGIDSGHLAQALMRTASHMAKAGVEDVFKGEGQAWGLIFPLISPVPVFHYLISESANYVQEVLNATHLLQFSRPVQDTCSPRACRGRALSAC